MESEDWLERENPAKLYENVEALPGCIFADLDGTLVKHKGTLERMLEGPLELLPGVREKLAKWRARGDKIFITTARPSRAWARTFDQLNEAGLPFHQLITDVGRGRRVVLNDLKPGSLCPTAVGITLERDMGLEDVDV